MLIPIQFIQSHFPEGTKYEVLELLNIVAVEVDEMFQKQGVDENESVLYSEYDNSDDFAEDLGKDEDGNER
ncbi:hypothetical protein O9G_002099 [Rozella allomycis CSF55]|uniref:Uncharacterized protein n=1 Tax=Rozella allomycis (strain CSF55) TaxID=988480 RepID=A0A075B575_ROZAC|nr:hypothetical protein O9G_002099 [Rozella allomycis CSF55]|eukprot:EPZ36818.1 hypothetical protein O9G_002099 [Rozella allomycis CSF55]